MQLWKELLLTLYYHATYPVRVWDYWRQASKDHLPVIILCYHRVADDEANDWTTPTKLFFQQMHWLQERFDFISLHDAQERICRGYNPAPCISITFDDGYADNCQQAIPWLIRHRIPCTYFVTLENVLKGKPFAHDLVMDHCLAPNTMEQLQAMAAAGVEIGAHAYTHCNLGVLADPGQLRHEVVAVKKDMQTALGRPVRYFAFPFGHYDHLNPTVFELAKAAGYSGVCSAYGGFNFPGDDPFHLQRITVDNVMIRLKNWVTMDRRKLHTKRFTYQKAEVGDREAGVSGQGIETGTREEVEERFPQPVS